MELLDKLILKRKELINFTNDILLTQRGILFTYFDFHSFNLSIQNEKYYSFLKHNFYLYQDGIGMYLALNMLNKDVDRIISTNYYNYLIKEFAKVKAKLFLIGYKFNEFLIKQKFQEKKLNLVGYYHGFFHNSELTDIINQIVNSKAEYLLLGMGKPQQEFFAIELKRNISHINCICVGNFFNYYFDFQKRAPCWITKIQLEWLYRLMQEPQRLYKRYLLGIPYFTYKILLLKLKKHFRGHKNVKGKIRNTTHSGLYFE